MRFISVNHCLSFVLFIWISNCAAQVSEPVLTDLKNEWRNGNIGESLVLCEKILLKEPSDCEALTFKIYALALKGRYMEAYNEFSRVDSSCRSFRELAKYLSVTAIHHHPINLHRASEYANYARDSFLIQAIRQLMQKPYSCRADRTFVIPFLKDVQYAESFPAIAGSVNGVKVNLRFDTGATYIIMGTKQAESFSLTLKLKGEAYHGLKLTRSWTSVVDTLEIAPGLKLYNVPAEVLQSIDDVIIGTNICENFLTTVDYPNKRLIVTPRNRKDLYEKHLQMLSPSRVSLSFYMWYDHYMFAKGTFERDGKKYSNLNFFFDSGLNALYTLDFGDGQGEQHFQAPFTCPGEGLINLGYNEVDVKKIPLVGDYCLELSGGLRQTHKVIHSSGTMDKTYYWSGIRIDGLISHAFLSKYAWTIDFDQNLYFFNY